LINKLSGLHEPGDQVNGLHEKVSILQAGTSAAELVKFCSLSGL
jgi:hypothetical protein